MKIRPLPNRRERGTGLRDRDFFWLISPSSCRYQLARKTPLWPFFLGFGATIAIDHRANGFERQTFAGIVSQEYYRRVSGAEDP